MLKNGFRLAERGEFSKRAFLNHKLDLTQAESIMDVISSTNKLALKCSQSSLRKSTYNLIIISSPFNSAEFQLPDTHNQS